MVRKEVMKTADRVIEERMQLLRKLAEEHKHLKK